MLHKLTLPEERFSPVDYFLERFLDPSTVSMIILTASAFERMKEDPYIHENEPGIFDCDEITIKGKFYPKMRYNVVPHASGNTYNVTGIKVGDKQYYFDLEPKDKKSIVLINY